MVPRRPRRRSLIQAAAGAALAGLAGLGRERPAGARDLGVDEVARLDRGEVVRFPLDLDLPRGDYFGGVAYAVIPVEAPRVMEVLLDPASHRSILPLTLESRVLGHHGQDMQVFIEHGGRLGTASYVLLVRRESPGLLRFWVDPSQPHDIADGWGYFRVQPWRRGETLLTYALLLHLDFGVVKMLFTETIRRYALGTPGLVRAYVLAHGGRG